MIRNCSNYVNLGRDYWRVAVKAHEENKKLIKALLYERMHIPGKSRISTIPKMKTAILTSWIDMQDSLVLTQKRGLGSILREDKPVTT